MRRSSNLLLGKLASALVLIVAEQFNDAALVGSKTAEIPLAPQIGATLLKVFNRNSSISGVPGNLLDELTDESSPLAEATLGTAHARLANTRGGLL